jgi:hypothetical protein
MTICKVALLCFAILLTGCKRSNTVSTSNGDRTVAENGTSAQSFTVTGKNGEKVTVASDSGKLPDDYPKDAPVLSGAKILVASATKTGDVKSYSLVLESDSFDNAVSFYKKALADNKWKSEATVSAGKMTMFSATKDSRTLVVQMTEADGKCSITQTLTNSAAGASL